MTTRAPGEQTRCISSSVLTVSGRCSSVWSMRTSPTEPASNGQGKTPRSCTTLTPGIWALSTLTHPSRMSLPQPRCSFCPIAISSPEGQGPVSHEPNLTRACLSKMAYLLPLDLDVFFGAAVGHGDHDPNADRDRDTDQGPRRADA